METAHVLCDLNPNLFHKIILMTGSHSLIIDLSNDVFFHTFYRHLTKISEIKMVGIGPKHRSGGPSKMNKNNEINYVFHKKIIVNQCPIIILHIQIKIWG